MQTKEYRHSHRVPCHAKGIALQNGRHIILETHNISLGGALVRFPEPHTLEIGSEIHITLDIGFNGRSIVCRTATDNASTLYGLKFDSPNRAGYFALGNQIIRYRKSYIQE
ncbi:MAG: PilZ domain-containing protein [Nitrosomonadales bacterium]|nr:PilZ domain-containing protein [Nitrosomonadales bacterium]